MVRRSVVGVSVRGWARARIGAGATAAALAVVVATTPGFGDDSLSVEMLGSCKYTKKGEDGGKSKYTLTCGSHTLDATGTIGGPSNFDLTFDITKVQDFLKSYGGSVAPFVEDGLITFNGGTLEITSAKKLTLQTKASLGALFTTPIKAITGEDLASFSRDLKAELSKDRVSVDLTLFSGKKESPAMPITGTQFRLDSAHVTFLAEKGTKTLSLVANTEIKPTKWDDEVAVDGHFGFNFSAKQFELGAKIKQWNNPFGVLPLKVSNASLDVKLKGTDLVALAATVGEAKLLDMYSFKGAFAFDPIKKTYGARFETPKLPLWLPFVVSDPVTLIALATPQGKDLAKDLDAITPTALEIKDVKFSFSPTGVNIMGVDVKKGLTFAAGWESTGIVANVDVEADPTADGKGVESGKLKADLDLTKFNDQVKNEVRKIPGIGRAAGALVANFNLKHLGLDATYKAKKVGGTASATVTLFGGDVACTVGLDKVFSSAKLPQELAKCLKDNVGKLGAKLADLAKQSAEKILKGMAPVAAKLKEVAKQAWSEAKHSMHSHDKCIGESEHRGEDGGNHFMSIAKDHVDEFLNKTLDDSLALLPVADCKKAIDQHWSQVKADIAKEVDGQAAATCQTVREWFSKDSSKGEGESKCKAKFTAIKGALDKTLDAERDKLLSVN